MSLIADEASQFMGGGSSRRFLTPVDMQVGETVRDRYRYMVSALKEENTLQKMMADTESAKAQEMASSLQVEALSSRDRHLDRLMQLDPTSDTFDDGMVELHSAAAHDPAIQRALNYKMEERSVYTEAMMGVAQSGAAANLSPDEHKSQVESARKFLLKGDVEGYGRILYQNSILAQQREKDLKLENMENNYEIQARHSELSAQRSEDRQKRMYDNQRERDLERLSVTHADKIQAIGMPTDIVEIDPDFVRGDIPGQEARLPYTMLRLTTDRLLEGAKSGILGDKDIQTGLQSVLTNPERYEGDELFAQALNNPTRKKYVDSMSKALLTMVDKDAFIETFGVREVDKDTRDLVMEGEEESEEFTEKATKLAEDAQFNSWLGNLWEEAQTIRNYSAEFERWRSIAPELAAPGIKSHNEKVSEKRKEAAEEKKVPAREKAAADAWIKNAKNFLTN